MDEKRLNELEKLCAKATPGPWETAWHAQRRQICEFSDPQYTYKFRIYGNTPKAGTEGDVELNHDANADLIVLAINALPDLIRTIRELRNQQVVECRALELEVEALRTLVDTMADEDTCDHCIARLRSACKSHDVCSTAIREACEAQARGEAQTKEESK